MSRLDRMNKQIFFLKAILDQKNEIFTQFSDKVSKDTKKKAWMKVRDVALSIGLIPCEKDYTYVRDATWPNLRNRTVVKLDRSKKTGEGGGAKFDECDDLVMEIIGKESPVVDGIGVGDSFDPQILIPSSPEVTNNEPQPHCSSQTEQPKKEGLKKRVIVRRNDTEHSMEELKRRKLQLEIRKLELEVWEKENVLKVMHSPLVEEHVSEISSSNEVIEICSSLLDEQ